MPKKQLTKNQHYIPQVYLKGFSEDSLTIYEYNYKKGQTIEEPVSIESICRKKYLYEVHDNKGEIIYANYIEDILCGYEGMFSKYRKLLLSKAHIRENYYKQCFLNREEKQFWIFYAALNIMRNPETLSGITSVFREGFQNGFTESEIRNTAMEFCLPFFENLKDGYNNALVFFIQVLLTCTITVAFDESDSLFTSDHAMYGSGNIKDNYEIAFHFLWFPVCSNCAILFTDPNLVNKTKRNCLIPITKDEVREMNKGIAYIAKQMVLSKHPFSDEDIRLIEEARRERAEDGEKGKTLTYNFDLFNNMR